MPFQPPRVPPPPRPPPYFTRARRPRPRTFAVTPEDLRRLDALAKHGYRHRSKVLRVIIRQLDDESAARLLAYATAPARQPGSPRLVTVSMAVPLDDLQKLNHWTTAAKFPSRSALVRAMIRWASDEL